MKLLIKITRKIAKLFGGRNGLQRAIDNPNCEKESMFTKLADAWYDVVGWFKSKLEMLERMLFWGWHMRWNWDFDGHCLYDIIYLKLDRLYKCHRDYGHCVWNQEEDATEYRDMVALRLAVRVAKRLAERGDTFYCKGLHDRHEAKWGKIDIKFESSIMMISSIPNANTPELIEQERKESRYLYEMDHKIRERDKKILFTLLRKKLDGWWD